MRHRSYENFISSSSFKLLISSFFSFFFYDKCDNPRSDMVKLWIELCQNDLLWKIDKVLLWRFFRRRLSRLLRINFCRDIIKILSELLLSPSRAVIVRKTKFTKPCCEWAEVNFVPDLAGGSKAKAIFFEFSRFTLSLVLRFFSYIECVCISRAQVLLFSFHTNPWIINFTW